MGVRDTLDDVDQAPTRPDLHRKAPRPVAIEYVNLLVTGEPVEIRARVARTLATRRLRLTWHDDGFATAQSGSFTRWGSLYVRIYLRVTSEGPGITDVRIKRESPLWWWVHGPMELAQAHRFFAMVCAELEEDFTEAGLLRSVDKT